MKFIVGLGNPGKKYKNTRHNAGRLVVEKIALAKTLSSVDNVNNFIQSVKFKADICQIQAKGEKIILVKPTTFMNSSGQAVSALMQYYKLDISDLIVISDDADIPLGQVRIRLEGGSGGHNGLQNIIDTLGSEQFIRVRIGISDAKKNLQEIDKKDSPIDTEDYVLSNFSRREIPRLEKVIELVSDEIIRHIGNKENFKAKTLEIE